MANRLFTKTITILVLLLSIMAKAKDKTIVDPTYYYNNEPSLSVAQVEFCDSATVLSFRMKGVPDSRFLVHAGAMLRDEHGRFYAATSSSGIMLGATEWMPANGVADFTISFRPMPTDTRIFDFVSSLVHRNHIAVLGISDGRSVTEAEKQRRYAQMSISEYARCGNAFEGRVHLTGKLLGYNTSRDAASIYLCEQGVLTDERSRVIAAAHINTNGTFVIDTDIDATGVYVLATEESASEWAVPVMVHKGDRLNLTIDLHACCLSAYKSSCSVNHLPKLQSLALLAPQFCIPADGTASRFSLATIESTHAKGRKIVEKIAKKYRGRYVEFVGMNALNMTSTINLLSNIRYDYYRNPDLKIVYLFNGRNVTHDYYGAFVERYMQGEDCHLLGADDYAAVREYMLSRQSNLVGTLNRNGVPFMFPLDYTDEYEFRRRFRMMMKSENLTDSEVEGLDTMIEVPDTMSITYGRERMAIFYDDGVPITHHQAKQDRRTLNILWWIVIVGGVLVLINIIWYIFKIKKKLKENIPNENKAVETQLDADESSQVDDAALQSSSSGGTSDIYFENLISALIAKKPKNRTFLDNLVRECPELTKREQALCMLYYSEDLPDSKLMELLEIPSPSAFRTAKSRLRKKLNNSEFSTLQI